MTARSPIYGLAIAAAGSLILTPDTLMMRLSGLSGAGMLAWRGGLTACVLLTIWVLIPGAHRRADLRVLFSGAGLVAVLAQAGNATLFSLSIAVAPVSVVLFGLASVPIFGALLARVLLGEPTRPATWVAMVCVLGGIFLAITDGSTGASFRETLLGALGGLATAICLALSFVMLRSRPELSVLLCVGLGGAISGTSGLLAAGPIGIAAGTLWPIMVSGAVILPLSFFLLTSAARHTTAANVSLLLLLETVLGPLFVWVGTGERPGPMMLTGGAIVVLSLAVYLTHMARVPANRLRT